MRIGKWQIPRRVLAGVAGGLAVVIGWIAWSLHTLPAGGSPVGGPQPFVRVAGTGGQIRDRVLREQAEYLDPTPLFFPAAKNYEQRELPTAIKRQASELFAGFSDKLVFAESKLPAWGAATVQGPERVADVLAQGVQAPFAGFGQIDGVQPTPPERSAVVEIMSLAEGKIIINQAIEPGANGLRRDAEPVQFLLTVSPAGIVGDLIPTLGGADEAVIASYRQLLEKTLRIDLRLAIGTFRVTVGP